jgi:predicted DNA-binding transcriptional regulator YafY
VRASRLLSIQMLLETRGRMSARALADALEVSMRTLYRDVDQLAAAGVPIYAERGRSGGFRLLEGWKTTLTGLTPSEAQAVFLSGLAGPAAQLGLGTQVETAKLKLLTALPAPWRNDAQRISSRLHVDPVDWYRQADAVPHLATVAAAVWNERQLTIRYESWKATVWRTVSPLGLVLKAGAWYLVAATDDEPRTYRISKVSEVQALEARCRRPRKFDLSRYWSESIRRFESELYQSQAVVLATAAGLEGLRNLNSAVSRAVADVHAPPGKDARVQVSIPIESIDHATGQLLRLSPQVQVIRPLALRQSLVLRLRQTCRMYGVGSRSQAGERATIRRRA